MRRVTVEVEQDGDMEILQVELNPAVAKNVQARAADLRVAVLKKLEEIDRTHPRYRAATVRIRGRW